MRALMLSTLILATVWLVLLSQVGYRLRWFAPEQRSWYQVQYKVPEQLTLKAKHDYEIEVTITNTGRMLWFSNGLNPTRLSYHWLDAVKDEVLIFEGLKTEIGSSVRPGEHTVLRAQIQAPTVPGNIV